MLFKCLYNMEMLRVHSFGAFQVFLFWFRNNRIHGISISKRTLHSLCFRSGNGIGGDLRTTIHVSAAA